MSLQIKSASLLVSEYAPATLAQDVRHRMHMSPLRTCDSRLCAKVITQVVYLARSMYAPCAAVCSGYISTPTKGVFLLLARAFAKILSCMSRRFPFAGSYDR